MIALHGDLHCLGNPFGGIRVTGVFDGVGDHRRQYAKFLLVAFVNFGEVIVNNNKRLWWVVKLGDTRVTQIRVTQIRVTPGNLTGWHGVTPPQSQPHRSVRSTFQRELVFVGSVRSLPVRNQHSNALQPSQMSLNRAGIYTHRNGNRLDRWVRVRSVLPRVIGVNDGYKLGGRIKHVRDRRADDQPNDEAAHTVFSAFTGISTRIRFSLALSVFRVAHVRV